MEALCCQLIPTHGRGFLTATCVNDAACSRLLRLTSRGPCRRVSIILCTRVSKSSLPQYGFHFWGTLKTPQLSGNSGSYPLKSACLSLIWVPFEDWKFQIKFGWGWFLGRTLLLIFRWKPSYCVLTWGQETGVRCFPGVFSYKDTNPIGSGPHPYDPF